ncbi:hypothetical protein Daus18300_008350 [Diaporthe australafricana]|uniref:Uncharacterized protein n=1 Tax=Diaporthe australafricana TaxID=127596 RepID=A0ABR3WJ70_9PEZI
MDPSKVKMGKLAQKFKLSQANGSKKDEQAAAPRSSGQGRLPSSASPGFVPASANSFKIFRDIDSPDIPTPEQLRISDLEQRLKVAIRRIKELEDNSTAQEEELMVARTQSKIDVDHEVIRLQQEIQTLEQHEDRLISELVSSDTQLKGLKTTEKDLKKRLKHFRTIYSLKHVYDDHLKKMSVAKQRTAKDLHKKFEEAEVKYMEEAFALYDYLEANGLQDTLPDYAKDWLGNSKGKKS